VDLIAAHLLALKMAERAEFLARKALQNIVVRICLAAALLACIYVVLEKGNGRLVFSARVARAVY